MMAMRSHICFQIESGSDQEPTARLVSESVDTLASRIASDAERERLADRRFLSRPVLGSSNVEHVGKQF
jgi:hypothetical protein